VGAELGFTVAVLQPDAPFLMRLGVAKPVAGHDAAGRPLGRSGYVYLASGRAF
jgi:hypothetical protein